MNFREFKWDKSMLDKLSPMNNPEYVVIHHSASEDVPIETIDQWHRNKGWNGVGYHYIIRKNGDVEKGRPNKKMGAHTIGHNHHGIGICLTGNFMNSTPTKEQMSALKELLETLKEAYPKVKVVRHRDLQATACPGDMFPWDNGPVFEAEEKTITSIPIVIIGNKVYPAERINGELVATLPVREAFAELGCLVDWKEETMTCYVRRG